MGVSSSRKTKTAAVKPPLPCGQPLTTVVHVFPCLCKYGRHASAFAIVFDLLACAPFSGGAALRRVENPYCVLRYCTLFMPHPVFFMKVPKTLVNVLSNCDSVSVLIWASAAGWVASLVLVCGQGILSLPEAMETWMEGMKVSLWSSCPSYSALHTPCLVLSTQLMDAVNCRW